METHYCWRCRLEMPMLDEAEWAEISPFLADSYPEIEAYRKKHRVSLEDARESVARQACAAFERLTGFHETNFLAILHHRLSLYGPPCPECGRLLRTPKAAFCVYCGYRVKPASATAKNVS